MPIRTERLALPIERTWDGLPLDGSERVAVVLERARDGLLVHIDAPYHGDPRPPAPPGRAPGLWNFEVVEVFVAGPGDAYVELEFGPHGHFLALALRGVRDLVSDSHAVEFVAKRAGPRWTGRAQIPSVAAHDGLSLPPRPWRVNAFAIHGVGDARRYLVHKRLPGSAPDFHQPSGFVSWG